MWKRLVWSTTLITWHLNYPLSIAAVKAVAWTIAKKSDQPNRFNSEAGPGGEWLRNFKKRQNLTSRKPDNIGWGRSRMANMMFFKQHFETIDRLNLRNKSQFEPPFSKEGGIDFLKFGNKGGDKIFFLERKGLN